MENQLDNSAQNENSPSVMAVGLRYGAIMAAVSIIYMLVLVAIGSTPFADDWINKGISILVTIGVIVLGHKYFKDNGDGYMSYGQGFGIAFLAILVSTIISMVFSYIYINFIDQSVFDAVWEKASADMEEKGQNQEAIDMAMEWGRKLFWVFYLIGGIFGGAIVALIVTIFTQKKRPVAF